MAERFYVNSPLALGRMEMTGSEAHHLATVCRLRPGHRVSLFNGDGREYPAEVRSVSRRSVTLEVTGVETPHRELGFPVVIAAPLPKGDRGQFLIEKLTELGITSFVPLRTRRSVVHPGETKLEKLERWVIEASKQCGRNVLLEVLPLAEWDEICRRDNLPKLRILAHPENDENPMGNWQMDGLRTEGVSFAVGPEGGFTEEEVAQGRKAGWRIVSLGPRVLRVETAALVLAGWINSLAWTRP